MKKYLFVFTVLAAFATTACHTSSKASTAQTLTTAPPQTIAATTPATDSVPTPLQPIQLVSKKGFVKKGPGALERQPMTPEERHRMLQGPPEVPTKKQ